MMHIFPMLNVPESVQAKIIEYGNFLETKIGDGPFEVRLFGSYARGRAFAGSDIDLAVISNSFQNLSWDARAKLLQSEAARLQRIAPVGITFLEFEFNHYPTVIRSIRSPNSLIACRNL